MSTDLVVGWGRIEISLGRKRRERMRFQRQEDMGMEGVDEIECDKLLLPKFVPGLDFEFDDILRCGKCSQMNAVNTRPHENWLMTRQIHIQSLSTRSILSPKYFLRTNLL
jgi:hypothetical protein